MLHMDYNRVPSLRPGGEGPPEGKFTKFDGKVNFGVRVRNQMGKRGHQPLFDE